MITKFQVQGPRSYQEDRYFISDNFLAVLDGHGSDKCAQYCATRLSEIIPCLSWDSSIDEMYRLFNVMAQECKDMESGAAFSAVHIGESFATVAILGDAPVIIIDDDGQPNFSPEHNVRSNQKEAQAAVSRGGALYNGYVCNPSGAGLQMSRALGDRKMGKIISTEPEIYQVSINSDSIILVASDGVVDPAHEDTGAQDAIVKLLRSGADAKLIVDSISHLQDNATAIVWRK